MKKLARHTAVACMGVAAITLATATVSSNTAEAATKSSSCIVGDMCLFYSSQAYGYGAEFGSSAAIPSFNPSNTPNGTYVFTAGTYGSSGAGSWVWNSAASAMSNSYGRNFRVYVNSNYTGASDLINYYNYPENIRSTKNNDASIRWGN